jgi:hypothetical protein
MNRKVLGLFVTLLAVAILALPMSTVSADKPEKFVSMTFYGYPSGDYTIEERYAGDNHILIWKDTDWSYCEGYIPIGDPPTFFMPVNSFAEGEYGGLWILHGASSSINAHAMNVRGVYEMVVTDWEGQDGSLVVLQIGNKLKIISGEVGGRKVHGYGTSEEVIFMMLYKYDFTMHFDP